MSVLELTLFALSSLLLRALLTSVAFALPVRAFSAVCIRADNWLTVLFSALLDTDESIPLSLALRLEELPLAVSTSFVISAIELAPGKALLSSLITLFPTRKQTVSAVIISSPSVSTMSILQMPDNASIVSVSVTVTTLFSVSTTAATLSATITSSTVALTFADIVAVRLTASPLTVNAKSIMREPLSPCLTSKIS